MTGFGQVETSAYRISLSTVNRKQFDAALQLPRSLVLLENRVNDCLRRRIRRGRIAGSIQLVSTASEGALLQIDPQRVAAVIGELRQAGEALSLPDDLTTSTLLRISDLIGIAEEDIDVDSAWADLEPALSACIEQVMIMRIAEGERMQTDLTERLQLLKSLRQEIAAHSECFTARKRADMATKLEAAGLPVDLDDERLLREIALFAERADITEEITRIDSHLEQFGLTFEQDDAVGRGLDFLCQELYREINTVGSKCADVEIAQKVISFKTELERIREQVQNVE